MKKIILYLFTTVLLSVFTSNAFAIRLLNPATSAAVVSNLKSNYPIPGKVRSIGSVTVEVHRDSHGNCAVIQDDPTSGDVHTELLGPGDSSSSFVVRVRC